MFELNVSYCPECKTSSVFEPDEHGYCATCYSKIKKGVFVLKQDNTKQEGK